MTNRTRLLLVGAGHAHLEVVRRAEELRAADYDVVLVAPPVFHYSGTASATATGELDPAAGKVDVVALTARAAVRHHVGRLVDLDLEGRRARTDTGVVLCHDVVSLNLGSVVGEVGIDVDASVVRAKPLDQLAALAARLAGAPAGSLRVTVVGGGATGLELATHLAVRPEVGALTLVEGGPDPGADLPRGARSRVLRLLAGRGVRVRAGAPVVEVGPTATRLADDSAVAHDVAVLATGLVSAAVPGMAGDGHGVPVRATLQHVDHDHVYAVGDCAHFLPQPLPCLGVHGVRQAPVLVNSLLARRRGDPLPRYRPPRHALTVLDLGAGDGLAVRGRLWWHGRAALRLKRRIDGRWLARYRDAERWS